MSQYTYPRILPRDFFNEAKLLKCLGMVSLAILDKMAPFDTVSIEVEQDDENEQSGFDVQLCDEGLYLANVDFRINCNNEEFDGTRIHFFSPYNSKENFPLRFYRDEEHGTEPVFTETGEFSPEFIAYIRGLQK